MPNERDAAFTEWHLAHPEFYDALVGLARNQAKKKGHLSMSVLFGVLRYQGYKVNDAFVGRFARLLQQQEPDLAPLFETRRLRS